MYENYYCLVPTLLFTLQKLKKIISATYFKNSRYRIKQFVKCKHMESIIKAEKTR